MKLSRKDFHTLQRAAEVAEAQKRLVDKGPEADQGQFGTVMLGTAAGFVLLLLSGLMIQGLIHEDRTEKIAGHDQIVWSEGSERILR